MLLRSLPHIGGISSPEDSFQGSTGHKGHLSGLLTETLDSRLFLYTCTIKQISTLSEAIGSVGRIRNGRPNVTAEFIAFIHHTAMKTNSGMSNLFLECRTANAGKSLTCNDIPYQVSTQTCLLNLNNRSWGLF